MRFKRIFLLSGLSPFLNRQVSPQIGIGYIAQTLEAKGFECTGFDFSNDRSIKRLLLRIKDSSCDLLGVHMMSHGYLRQFEILRTIKETFPKIKIAVGGPHSSIYGPRTLEENPFIDFACLLEGESTLLEICLGKNLKDIDGLVYRDSGGINENGERPLLKNLDSLPFPRYGGFDLSAYPSKIMSIVTSRGCPYQCTFCPVRTAIGCQYRTRSAQNVFEEISYWYGKGYREIWIQDDNFTMIPPRVDELLELIINAPLPGIRFALPNGIRSDKVDKELLLKMKRAGFFHVAFGVEAGNDRILANIKKSEKIEDIVAAIELTLSAGIRVSLFFLVGSPGETASDLEDSFNIVRRFPVASAEFYNIVPFPKTELYDWLEENRLLLYRPEDFLNRIDHFSLEPIFITPELDSSSRKNLLQKAREVSRAARERYIKEKMPPYLRFIPSGFYPLLEKGFELKRKLFKR